jgi:hypothetical protein
MNKEVVSEIDRTIKSIWMNEIPRDYKNHYLLKEDTLKNALYFHLRRKLKKFLEDNRLRIYTEFTDATLKKIHFRADLIITKLPEGRKKSGYLGDIFDGLDIVAAFELKHNTRNIDDAVRDDIDKFKQYLQKAEFEHCQFYMVSILEYICDFNTPSFLDGRTTENWAKDCVTELTAGRNEKGCMDFYVVSHNGMNNEFDYNPENPKKKIKRVELLLP